MGYTPPTLQQIIADMINTYSSLDPRATDMNVGSVVRSILTADAIGFKRNYTAQAENTLMQQRIGPYAAFNFQKLQPQVAYTMEQVTALAPSADVTVPQGTIFVIPGTNTQYQTPANFVWPAGQAQQSIRIVCMQAGSIGNTIAGTITQLVTPIAGLSGVTCTNIKNVINGTDLETEEEQGQRFTGYLASIHRGDVGALNYGVKQAILYDDYGYISEQVVKSQVVEGSGSNVIYIDNGTYDTSDALVARCQQVIYGYYDSSGNPVNGYKAAGIPCTVIKAGLQPVGIAAQVTPATGFTLAMVASTIINNLISLVQGFSIGGVLLGTAQGILLLSAIGAAIGSVRGVQNYKVTVPTADTTPAAGTLLHLSGTPAITQL